MICVYLSTEVYDPVSAFIRYGTHSDWSHAGFWDSDRKATLSAMIKGGVTYRPLPKKHLFLTGNGVELAYSWARTQLGKPYDWGAITGILLNHDWRKEGSWFCSELVAAAFERADYPLFDPMMDVQRITPRDLEMTPHLKVL